ncbi:MAG TPA: hypothetical protein VMT27_07730 [Actinomycetes bacterium]|nr:hypothetical protein [Actinomycetes bacterium]
MTEVCDEREAMCRCSKEAGHVEAGDKVHECHPDRCTGAWEKDPFKIVMLPFPVGDPRPWESE